MTNYDDQADEIFSLLKNPFSPAYYAPERPSFSDFNLDPSNEHDKLIFRAIFLACEADTCALINNDGFKQFPMQTPQGGKLSAMLEFVLSFNELKHTCYAPTFNKIKR